MPRSSRLYGWRGSDCCSPPPPTLAGHARSHEMPLVHWLSFFVPFSIMNWQLVLLASGTMALTMGGVVTASRRRSCRHHQGPPFRRLRVAPDGNCMFSSLCVGLYRAYAPAPERVRALRHEVVRDVVERWDDTRNYLPEYASCHDYEQDMLHRRGWGGEVELAAFASLYRRCVKVFCSHTRRWYVYKPRDSDVCSRNKIYLTFGNNHYDALMPSSS